jgi:arginase
MIEKSKIKFKKKYGFLGAAIGWGAQRFETEQGPEFLLEEANLLKFLVEQTEAGQSDYQWVKTVLPRVHATGHYPLLTCAKNYAEILDYIIDFNTRLANHITHTIKQGLFPVTIGGDHSLAIGTWSGIIHALDAAQQFGLLWIDAHMDSHTPQTTPSHAIHGMPLAVLLGHGEPALVNIAQSVVKLLPKQVVLYGVRSFEKGEADLLAGLHVRIYDMEEIRDRGVEVTLAEAVNQVALAPKGFGVSIDLDAFDPKEAPGVGSPASGGLFSEVFLPELKKVLQHPKLQALELTEFNPVLDKNKLTEKLIFNILGIL